MESPPKVVILGADALLAALPATPTQLANACFAAGFETVLPPNWGDELVAAGCVHHLEHRTGPALQCSCPLVAEQLRGVSSLSKVIVPLVSPPVACARYLRALCDYAPLHLTYIGDCPGADDPVIDVHLSPRDFLTSLAEQGIAPIAQRPDVGPTAPRDRRRFYSLPGGVPTPEWLGADWPKRTLIDLQAGDALSDLARHVTARENTLIDIAPQLGCACSGAVGGIAPADARRQVMALEPPRARTEVLDAHIAVDVSAPSPASGSAAEVTWADFVATLPTALKMHEPAARPSRPVPVRRTREGSSLPRAYLAARPRSLRPRRQRVAPPPSASRPAAPAPEPRSPSADPAIGRPEITAGTRRAYVVPRRGTEGGTGPYRGARAALATGDRWLLFALAAASVLTSVATLSTARRGSAPTPVQVARTDTVYLARAESTSAGAASDPVSSRTDSAVGVSVPPAAPLSRGKPERAADASREVPHPGPRPTPTPRRVGERALRPPSTTVVARRPEALSATPPVPPPRVARDSTRTVVADSSRVPAASMVTTGPVLSPTARGTTAAAPTPPPPTPAPAPARADSAGASSASSNIDVAAELRAIRAEIEARKRRVDSLTSSLDSLRRVTPPR